MTTTYYSVTTDAFSTFLNDFIISGSTTLDLTGWSVKLGTGNLQPTHETTDLINVIYDKDTTGYLGFTASVYASGGQLISIPIPNSVLEGNIITEIGLYDSNDVLMCAAATYLDLTRTSAQGLQPNFIEQLVLKDIPSGVTVVYETWDDYQLRSEKNQANGYAGLDANAKVITSLLNDAGATQKGILKLFTDLLNSNEDGTATQKAIKDALDGKLSKDLDNLSSLGQAILDKKVEVEALLQQNGYAKFSWKENNQISNLIICWGGNISGNYVTTSGLDLNFPTTFNNYVRITSAKVTSASTTTDSHVFVRGLGLTKFNAYVTSGNTNINYIAIGN